MKLLLILATLLFPILNTSFAEETYTMPEEDFMVDEEGTPSEYSFPLGEAEMEKADLERQEDVLQPDAANTDWNMDDVAPEENF